MPNVLSIVLSTPVCPATPNISRPSITVHDSWRTIHHIQHCCIVSRAINRIHFIYMFLWYLTGNIITVQWRIGLSGYFAECCDFDLRIEQYFLWCTNCCSVIFLLFTSSMLLKSLVIQNILHYERIVFARSKFFL